MKHFLLLTIFLLGGQAVCAQDWARARVEKSPRHNEWVTVKHDNRSVETFVVYPTSKDKVPVVLVIHGNAGITDWVEDEADQIAEAGYIAVVPDLLSGMGPNGGRTSAFPSQDKAIEVTAHLNPDQITSDLNAVADYGLKLSGSSGKLFVVGFDWGGGQGFRFAADRPDLAAAFVFYGPLPDKDTMARIKAPVYAFYAKNDEHVVEMVSDTTASMSAAGKSYEAVIYEGADHGLTQTHQDRFNADLLAFINA